MVHRVGNLTEKSTKSRLSCLLGIAAQQVPVGPVLDHAHIFDLAAHRRYRLGSCEEKHVAVEQIAGGTGHNAGHFPSVMGGQNLVQFQTVAVDQRFVKIEYTDFLDAVAQQRQARQDCAAHVAQARHRQPQTCGFWMEKPVQHFITPVKGRVEHRGPMGQNDRVQVRVQAARGGRQQQTRPLRLHHFRRCGDGVDAPAVEGVPMDQQYQGVKGRVGWNRALGQTAPQVGAADAAPGITGNHWKSASLQMRRSVAMSSST